jgi:hypothetical protein
METETIKNITIGISLAVTGYWALLCSLNELSFYKSEKIKSQEHLEQMLAEEKKRLNLDKDISVCELENFTSKSGRFEDGSYGIFLSSNQMNRIALRHEIYHISENHGQPKRNLLKYLFYEEPKTILHCLKSRFTEDKF